jgi:hypothetical protein
MPIRFASEPQNGSLIVRAGLDRLAARESHLKLSKEASSALALGSSHAVYDLRADEISKGGGLETAHPTGFRYLITAAGAPVAAAEVQADASGKASVLANLNYGPYVQATAQAFDNLPTLPSMPAGSYEARLLRFSTIYLMAIWLKADTGGADIIYPLAPAPGGLQAGRLYTVADFLNAIRPLAEKRTAKTSSSPVP